MNPPPRRMRTLTGHGLLSEVRRLAECQVCRNPPPSKNYRSRPGHGVCACGEVGEHFATAQERRRWHEGHKELVRIRLVSQWMHSSYERVDNRDDEPVHLVRSAAGRLVHRSNCPMLNAFHDVSVQDWTWARDRPLEEVRLAMPMIGSLACEICRPFTDVARD